MPGPPVGACCYGTVCVAGLTGNQCVTTGGFWQGPNSNCTSSPCAPPPPPPEPPPPPPPNTIVINNIPLKAFTQYQQGRRNAIIITLQYPPQIGQSVRLVREQLSPPPGSSPIINTNIRHIIENDNFLNSKQYYTLEFTL